MVIGQVGIAFLLSLFFTMEWVKLREFHRYVMFFPVVISPVVIGLMWQLIYNQDIGLLNFLLKNLGLGSIIKPWLDDPRIIMQTVSVPVIWQFIGFYLIILCSAVASIPKEIFESAEIDGATGFKKSIYVTIPMTYDSLKICIMLCTIGSMKAFDHIMVLTNGGPGKASTVLALYGYNTAFTTMRLSYSNTIAIAILVLTLIITLTSRVLLGGKKYE
jgi:ABC-type sugar transport systems, permease components